jgi:outer membrane protein TolC
MPFARFALTIRLTTIAALLTTFTLRGLAQQQPAAAAPEAPRVPLLAVTDYTKPVSHFPNPVGPYTARHLPPPNLANTPRMDSLMHDGKLYLSVDDAIALALENNLDIAIARYNLNIADTDVLRAQAGSVTLGVPTGIVQNTPGGGVGGIGAQVGTGTGGTTLGAGGAGAGAGGLVGSTLGLGPSLNSFDPIVTGTLQEDHLSQRTTTLFQGVSPIGESLVQNTGTVNFAYNQAFAWGTNVQVGFNNSRVTTNSAFQGISPQLSSNFRATFTQHLLQGLGFAANTRFIRIAKNNRELSDVAFRLQVTATVDQIENMYWDLVYAYENQRVKRESLAFSQKTLSDTIKQVDIGSLAPIESVRARSTVASDEQALTVAQTNLQLQQLLMKNALSRTLHDPTLALSEVIPTSTMELPQSEQAQPIEDLVNQAVQHRAELVEARIQLNSQEQSNKAVRSALLPTLDLFAYYGGAGLGGNQNALQACATPPTELQQIFGCASPGSAFDPIFPSTGIGSTLHQLVNSTSPDKGVGLQLNIPIRNRAAQATQIRSELEYRQLQMNLQQRENTVSIEVRNAQFGVEQNRASVASAKAAVDFARQSLDAEQKKYQFGTSTTTAVLQNQSALATAESTLLSAMAAYEKSRVELERAVGTLLDENGVSIDDAARGQVTHLPRVPYVAPRKDLPAPTPTAQPQQ